jgi:hypothetical protein
MRLELSGVLFADGPDEASIAAALGRMRGDDVLTLRRPPADFIQASGSAEGGFRLNAYEDARGVSLASAGPRLEAAQVSAIFLRFLRQEDDWHSGVAWQSGAEAQRRSGRRFPGAAGLIALAIFGAAYLAAGAWMWLEQPPGVTWGDYLLGWAAILGLSLYIGWLDLFFSLLRPRLGDQIGGVLGMQVSESLSPLDAGTWRASGGAPGNRLVVYGLDILALIAATLLPLAILGAAALILFSR